MIPLFDKYSPLWNMIRSNRKSYLLSVPWVASVAWGRSLLGLDTWWGFSAVVLTPLLLQYITAVCLYRYVVRRTIVSEEASNDELVLICLIRNAATVNINWITLILCLTQLGLFFVTGLPSYALSGLLLAEVLVYTVFVVPIWMKNQNGS